MSKFRIETQHELYMTYVVEAKTEEEALKKLQDLGDNGSEIIAEYCGEPKTWGVNEHLLEQEGIVVDDEDAWVSCPLPTGKLGRAERAWKVTEEVNDEG